MWSGTTATMSHSTTEITIIVILSFIVALIMVIIIVKLCIRFNICQCCDPDSDSLAESLDPDDEELDEDDLEEDNGNGPHSNDDDDVAEDDENGTTIGNDCAIVSHVEIETKIFEEDNMEDDGICGGSSEKTTGSRNTGDSQDAGGLKMENPRVYDGIKHYSMKTKESAHPSDSLNKDTTLNLNNDLTPNLNNSTTDCYILTEDKPIKKLKCDNVITPWKLPSLFKHPGCSSPMTTEATELKTQPVQSVNCQSNDQVTCKSPPIFNKLTATTTTVPEDDKLFSYGIKLIPYNNTQANSLNNCSELPGNHPDNSEIQENQTILHEESTGKVPTNDISQGSINAHNCQNLQTHRLENNDRIVNRSPNKEDGIARKVYRSSHQEDGIAKNFNRSPSQEDVIANNDPVLEELDAHNTLYDMQGPHDFLL